MSTQGENMKKLAGFILILLISTWAAAAQGIDDQACTMRGFVRGSAEYVQCRRLRVQIRSTDPLESIQAQTMLELLRPTFPEGRRSRPQQPEKSVDDFWRALDEAQPTRSEQPHSLARDNGEEAWRIIDSHSGGSAAPPAPQRCFMFYDPTLLGGQMICR